MLALGFHEAIRVDILSGNISIFEQVFLWTAFLLLEKNRPYIFSLLICVVATLKLTPIIFLGLLVLKRQYSIFVGAVTAFIAYLMLMKIFFKETVDQFFSLTNLLDSSGFVNPSSFVFFELELAPKLRLLGISSTDWIYFLYIIVMIMLALYLWLNYFHNVHFRYQLMMFCLWYAALLPRFKDYSFILLLVPAYFLFEFCKNNYQRFALFLTVCLTLFPYHHLFTIFILIACYVNLCIKEKLNA